MTSKLRDYWLGFVDWLWLLGGWGGDKSVGAELRGGEVSLVLC